MIFNFCQLPCITPNAEPESHCLIWLLRSINYDNASPSFPKWVDKAITRFLELNVIFISLWRPLSFGKIQSAIQSLKLSTLSFSRRLIFLIAHVVYMDPQSISVLLSALSIPFSVV